MTLRDQLHAEIAKLPEAELKKLAKRLALEEKAAQPRTLGAGKWQGKIKIADDFDELPEDILRVLTGESDEPTP